MCTIHYKLKFLMKYAETAEVNCTAKNSVAP